MWTGGGRGRGKGERGKMGMGKGGGRKGEDAVEEEEGGPKEISLAKNPIICISEYRRV